MLLFGPPAPAGWVYRDFRPMPQIVWLRLLDLLGEENIQVVAASSRFLPPAPLCRAQLFINENAQAVWRDFLKRTAS